MSALLFKETYPNYKYSTPEFEKRSGDLRKYVYNKLLLQNPLCNGN